PTADPAPAPRRHRPPRPAGIRPAGGVRGGLRVSREAGGRLRARRFGARRFGGRGFGARRAGTVPPCAWRRACVRRIVDNLGYRTAEWGAMSDDTPSSPLLVISAHAGDFVWRAAGAIALATERGDRAKVVCLSYGERG